jgi:hypothetical protein
MLGDIMASVIGVIDSLIHNILGLAIIALIAGFIYLKYLKPKPIDMGKEVFRKRWEATTTRLRLPMKKQLALCSYPMSTEELQKMPIYQIQHQNIGSIIGINVFGVITNPKTLMSFINSPNTENYDKLVEENQEYINKDKFWLAFACEKGSTGRPMFKKTHRTMLFIKPNQIINLNSSDNIIRVRGFGLTPIGDYEIINDENININRTQFVSDTTHTISEEVVLGAYSMLGTIVEKAISGDAPYRKEIAKEGIKVLNVPEKNSEVQQ